MLRHLVGQLEHIYQVIEYMIIHMEKQEELEAQSGEHMLKYDKIQMQEIYICTMI